MAPSKRAFILFVLGFFLGPVGDYGHVATGTTGYPPEIFGLYWFGLPFWVPFLFGTATLAIGLTHPWMDTLFGKVPQRPGARGLGIALWGVLAFLILYLLSGVLPGPAGGRNDGILWGLALLLWLLLDRSWQGLVLGCLTALVGVAVEILLVQAGAFFYLTERANLFGVASWLPALYFVASFTVGNFGRWLQKTLR